MSVFDASHAAENGPNFRVRPDRQTKTTKLQAFDLRIVMELMGIEPTASCLQSTL